MGNWKEAFRDERLLVLERVLRSKALSRSDSSQQILKFIVEKLVSGRCDDLKEYTIATEAMGRSPDFDPKADSIVRIQMQRLRKKLEEYYNEEGAGDPIRITIPSGHYVPEFQSTLRRGPPKQSQEPDQQPKPERSFAGAYRMLPSILPWGLVALLLVVVVIMGVRLSRIPASGTISSFVGEPLPDSLTQLWKPFISPDVPLIIVYSNPAFLCDKSDNLYRFPLSSSHSLIFGAWVRSLDGLEQSTPIHPSVGTLFYSDTYTGTGEAVAAGKIAKLLATAKQDFSLERSRLVSYDNVRNSNVVFIGGSAEDTILAGLPVETDFGFDHSNDGFILVDRHPAPGQPATYRALRDHISGEFQADFALISLLPGVAPDRHILVLAGITTLGTQAAAEFATSAPRMALLEKMRGNSHGNPVRSPYFQALLEVLIRKGAVAQINCLYIRELRNK